MTPIKSRPLIDQEIEELDAFLLPTTASKMQWMCPASTAFSAQCYRGRMSSCVLACPPCTCERHHRRYATTDSQGARSRPQRPMPLWLWQEVQALPWSTEIVALTCGIQNCLRPPSSLVKRPRQACCATPVQDQKCWNTAAFEQSQFIDHTGCCRPAKPPGK